MKIEIDVREYAELMCYKYLVTQLAKANDKKPIPKHSLTEMLSKLNPLIDKTVKDALRGYIPRGIF